MANPSKQKGTAGETELLRLLQDVGGWRWGRAVRNPPSALTDITRPGGQNEPAIAQPVQVLATRPDRGQWLFTMDAPTFIRCVEGLDAVGFVAIEEPTINIEVKRYARFSLHSIFEQKFPQR